MDFTTRDRYRHVVEDIARKGRLPEDEVVRCAIRLAAGGGPRIEGDPERAKHVGYYLVDKGLPLLRHVLHIHTSPLVAMRASGGAGALALYAGQSLLLAAVIATGIFIAARSGEAHAWKLWAVARPACICAGGLSITLLNWVATIFTVPHILPRMDFTDGVPLGARTLVVVPSMLSSILEIERLVESLEVHFLANRDDNLYFGLLTDLPDAEEKVLPGDSELVQHARLKIEELNGRYGNGVSDPCFLFHRGRRWNAQDGAWMGHERKREKLSDLNALLRGGNTDGFDIIIGKVEHLPSVRYVITLDSDTQLPRDAARKLAATMAHPLNHPRYDESRGRIVEGYGILQPRVAASL